jgi:hypothetical protein
VNGTPIRSLLKAGVVVLACVSLVLACGGGARSADEIARSIQAATHSKAADEAVCNALEVYGSKPAEPLSDLLRYYAQQRAVDASGTDELIAAADGIEASQLASEVLSNLNC